MPASCSHLLQVGVDIIVVEFPPSREVGKYDLQVQNFLIHISCLINYYYLRFR